MFGGKFRGPVVRATNTGIYAAMRADGTLLDLSPPGAEWPHLYEIPYGRAPHLTFPRNTGTVSCPWPSGRRRRS